METKEAILKRRSIRVFKDTEVSKEIIEELLKSAMAAPSALNRQPWVFYVIKNKDILEKIKKISPFTDKNSNLIIFVCGNVSGINPLNLNDFWIQDLSAAVENILISAADMGLGSLWCGVYPRVERVNAIKTILKTPKNIIPFAMIHIGYPKEEKEPRTQYDPAKVIYID
ncbi:nitroreductase family protein [bacterium]|nr:nitroreductase family protein [bacterium]